MLVGVVVMYRKKKYAQEIAIALKKASLVAVIMLKHGTNSMLNIFKNKGQRSALISSVCLLNPDIYPFIQSLNA